MIALKPVPYRLQLASAREMAANRSGAQVVFTDLSVDAGESLAASLGGKATFIRQDAASAADWDAVMAALWLSPARRAMEAEQFSAADEAFRA